MEASSYTRAADDHRSSESLEGSGAHHPRAPSATHNSCLSARTRSPASPTLCAPVAAQGASDGLSGRAPPPRTTLARSHANTRRHRGADPPGPTYVRLPQPPLRIPAMPLYRSKIARSHLSAHSPACTASAVASAPTKSSRGRARFLGTTEARQWLPPRSKGRSTAVAVPVALAILAP